MISYIKKPRYWISNKHRRFVGFKVGQVVWHNFRGPRQYIITQIEDCYDWAYRGPFIQGKRQQYSIYIWTKPFKPTPTWNKISSKSLLKKNAVMRYNDNLWNTGHIGHGVDYSELFHTKGEAYWEKLNG